MSDTLDLITEPLKEVFREFMAFLPNLLAMLVILIAGIILARLVRLILLRFLKAVNFDAWADRMGITAILRKGDLWAKPSLAVGSIIFWLLIIVALMTGMSALKFTAIDQIVSKFFLYLPRFNTVQFQRASGSGIPREIPPTAHRWARDTSSRSFMWTRRKSWHPPPPG